MNPTDLANEIAEMMADVGCAPDSATLYGSVASGTSDADSDVDILCVAEALPDEDLNHNLEGLLDRHYEQDINITWVTIDHAREMCLDPGNPITAAVANGIRFVGGPLRVLLPHAVPFDESEAARRSHERSKARVSELKARDLSIAREHDLAELLRDAANAALLHHALGRFKTSGSRLNRSCDRLATLIGEERAALVAQLYSSLQNPLKYPDPETVSSVSAVVDALIESASDPDAPGASTLD